MTFSIAFLIYSSLSRETPSPVAIGPKQHNLNAITEAETTDGEHLQHTISNMLRGDERNLYQMIASAGGEMLQKDIVASRVFSKAKVSRLLDRLEEKNLILRERYGMTNKIRLTAPEMKFHDSETGFT